METTLARLNELLSIVESSGKVLQASLAEHAKDNTASGVADRLDLPFHADPETANHAATLRVVAERLAQLVTPPRHVVFEAAGSFYITLCLHTMLKADVATLIEDIDPSGVPTTILAQKAGLDSDMLPRMLRHLATKGIFQETQPGVWANTVASKTIAHCPEFCAHLDLCMYEGTLVLPHWPEFLAARASDVQPAPSSPFAIYSNGEAFYKWVHSGVPAAAGRGANFNTAMRGMADTEGVAFLPADYSFASLDPGTKIIDVGGGLGSLPELVLPEASHLKFMVQDLAPVIKQAAEIGACKKWVDQGTVQFIEQDCFEPQPDEAKGGNVFVLKTMLHNYPDSKATEILKHVRAAEPSALLVIDRAIVPVLRTQATSPEEEKALYDFLRKDGTQSLQAPTMYDLGMAALHGGRVRSLSEWTALLDATGFKLNRVFRMRASTGQAVLECVPV
ncbi:O-methyltransferase-domain-containing protein [Mycena albidolilacea]|uniref:O-methyltransferase-domain-containing protein n=1 Tax=Mycena albidolilacea TaxID=1033008 RepID=A0AAD6ZFP4_9AGAR|nr:O-methyltransferase-domain-containing protein [Mycena albidolilacea]